MKNSIWLLLMLLSACANPARNLYDGMQQREGIANPHAQPTNKQPNYDQYEAERNKLREQEVTETTTPSGTSR
jgi:hypothetical protein